MVHKEDNAAVDPVHQTAQEETLMVKLLFFQSNIIIIVNNHDDNIQSVYQDNWFPMNNQYSYLLLKEMVHREDSVAVDPVLQTVLEETLMVRFVFS